MEKDVAEELLEKIKQKINEGYEEYRMDKELVYYAEQVSLSSSPSKDEITAKMGKLPCYDEYAWKEVEPKNIGFIRDLKSDLSKYTTKTLLMQYSRRLGIKLAENEYCYIVGRILENAGHIIEVETEGTLTISDLVKAERKIEGFETGSRVEVVIPEKCFSKIEKEIDKPEGRRVPYLMGLWANMLYIYRASFLADEAVLFARDRIIVRNTLHTIDYEDMKLVIEKWCSSAPLTDKAVVKIKIKS